MKKKQHKLIILTKNEKEKLKTKNTSGVKAKKRWRGLKRQLANGSNQVMSHTNMIWRTYA